MSSQRIGSSTTLSRPEHARGSAWNLAEAPPREVRSPGEAQRLYEEARSGLRERQETEAFELLQEVLWHDPEHAEALSWFGLCVAKLHGQNAEALELCRKALDLAPSNAEVRTNLGRVQRLCGDNAAAHRTFLGAYRQDPRNPGPATELTRMGVRRRPVLTFLSREHWCNRILGLARYRVQRILTAPPRRA
jgi:Flp pilus assembly protein TadD